MNEIIVTLIASAFGTGGIAGVAALINLGGKYRQHKRLERLSETEKLFDHDETVKNSLTAARRVLATEIAASILVRNTLGRFFLMFGPLVIIYVYLFWVIWSYYEGVLESELLLTLFTFLIASIAYATTVRWITRHSRQQQDLQEALLKHELSAKEIIDVTQQMYSYRHQGAFEFKVYRDRPEDILRSMESKNNPDFLDPS